VDRRGRFADNIFVERLWRSVNYEEIYLKAYESVAQARRGIGAYFEFYNHQRLHQALGYRTPRQVMEEGLFEPIMAFSVPQSQRHHHIPRQSSALVSKTKDY